MDESVEQLTQSLRAKHAAQAAEEAAARNVQSAEWAEARQRFKQSIAALAALGPGMVTSHAMTAELVTVERRIPRRKTLSEAIRLPADYPVYNSEVQELPAWEFCSGEVNRPMGDGSWDERMRFFVTADGRFVSLAQHASHCAEQSEDWLLSDLHACGYRTADEVCRRAVELQWIDAPSELRGINPLEG